ncbi:MAG: hypothetical protein KAQ74_02630, partial [Dehalococcoidia bacterium]|nr:hypothetical protein [Dehalococcoidia bacterium]
MRRVLLALLLTLLVAVPLGCSGGDDEADDGGAAAFPSGGAGGQTVDEGMDEKEIDEQESAVGNRPPEVSLIGLAPPYTDVAKNARVGITCTASDPDGDAIEYKWAANGGSFDSVEVFRCMWWAPEVTGKFVVTVT